MTVVTGGFEEGTTGTGHRSLDAYARGIVVGSGRAKGREVEGLEMCWLEEEEEEEDDVGVGSTLADSLESMGWATAHPFMTPGLAFCWERKCSVCSAKPAGIPGQVQGLAARLRLPGAVDADGLPLFFQAAIWQNYCGR